MNKEIFDVIESALTRAGYENAIRWFARVWDTTIKPADQARCGWDANPWVWAISFERISREEAFR